MYNRIGYNDVSIVCCKMEDDPFILREVLNNSFMNDQSTKMEKRGFPFSSFLNSLYD